MKIMFVNPPSMDDQKYIREGRCMQSIDSWAAIWPPLTLAILASIAKKYGEVRMIDWNVEEISRDEMIQETVSFNPDIVVSCPTFPSIDSDASFAREVKEGCPHAVMLGFGVFFTLLEKKSLQDIKGYDVALCGEPEETFEEFLVNYQSTKKIIPIQGLIWREEDQVKMGDPRPFIRDIDTIPTAARDLLKNDRYRLPNNGRPFTLVNVARGCPYSCTFCTANIYYGKKLRHHSVEYVINEIEACIKDHGIRDFLFWEEVFTLEKSFGRALCDEIIKRDLKISWMTTTRADLIDEDFLRKMKAAGCVLLGMGIESCSQKILDTVKKNEKVEHIVRAVELCKKVKIPTMGHFIFGLPGETESTAQETIKYIRTLGLDYMQCYCAVPIPKTPLGEMAREKGWITTKRWSEYDYGGNSIMNIGTVSPADVDRYRQTAFRKFYLRPKYVLKQLTAIKSLRQIMQAANFLKWMKTKPRD